MRYQYNRNQSIFYKNSFLDSNAKPSAFFCLNLIGTYSRTQNTHSLISSDMRTASLLLGLFVFDTLNVEEIDFLFQNLHIEVSARAVRKIVADLQADKCIDEVKGARAAFYRLKKAGYTYALQLVAGMRTQGIVPANPRLAFEDMAYSENYNAVVPGIHKVNVDKTAMQMLGLSFSDLYMSYDVTASAWTETDSYTSEPFLREEGALSADIFVSDYAYSLCAYEDHLRKRGIHIEVDNDTERLGKKGGLTRKLLSYCEATNALTVGGNAYRHGGVYNVLLAYSSENRARKLLSPEKELPTVNYLFDAKLATMQRIETFFSHKVTSDNFFELAEILYPKQFASKCREIEEYALRQRLSDASHGSYTAFLLATSKKIQAEAFEGKQRASEAHREHIITSFRKRLCEYFMDECLSGKEDTVRDAFNHGFSLQATHLSESSVYLADKTLSYYLDSVPKVLNKLGLFDTVKNVKAYHDCRPVCINKEDECSVYLRNILNLPTADGTPFIVAVEDLSNDLGAYSRIRTYFETPCTIAQNILLLILTDGFKSFDGTHYDEYNLFQKADDSSILHAYNALYTPHSMSGLEEEIITPLHTHAMSYIMMDRAYYTALLHNETYVGDYPAAYINAHGYLLKVDFKLSPPIGFFNTVMPMNKTYGLSINPHIYT